MSQEDILVVRAGKRALARLRDGGVERNDIGAMVGASGGPKWLVLSRLDLALQELIVSARERPLAVVGSSIGSFRHLCHAHDDPHAAFARFEEAYIEQTYDRPPTGAEVSAESRRILDILLGDGGIRSVLEHPTIQSHVVAVRSKGPAASALRPVLALGLGVAAASNAVARPALSAFFDRVVFHNATPAFGFRGFATQEVPLDAANLVDAVLASGSIPLVMEPVVDIAGAGPGRYLDGGIIDYHFDFDFTAPDGLILYPHFFDRVTPGWFDKSLPWRKPHGDALEDTVMVAPSPAFVARLPGAKVPDRDDFKDLVTAARKRRWYDIVDRCCALSDRFGELWESGRLGEHAVPFE